MARRKHVSVITGISGRLGQLLARRLHRIDGEVVLGIDRRAFSRRPADVEHFRIDIRRKAAEDVFRTRRVDVIYHLGVMHDPRKDTSEHHSWNILGTRQILDFAKRYGVPKVVILSTGDVYGPQSDNPAYIAEDAPLLGAQRFAKSFLHDGPGHLRRQLRFTGVQYRDQEDRRHTGARRRGLS